MKHSKQNYFATFFALVFITFSTVYQQVFCLKKYGMPNNDIPYHNLFYNYYYASFARASFMRRIASMIFSSLVA